MKFGDKVSVCMGPVALPPLLSACEMSPALCVCEMFLRPQISKPSLLQGRVRIVGQASLRIQNLTFSDEGDYRCEIALVDGADARVHVMVGKYHVGVKLPLLMVPMLRSMSW